MNKFFSLGVLLSLCSAVFSQEHVSGSSSEAETIPTDLNNIPNAVSVNNTGQIPGQPVVVNFGDAEFISQEGSYALDLEMINGELEIINEEFSNLESGEISITITNGESGNQSEVIINILDGEYGVFMGEEAEMQ